MALIRILILLLRDSGCIKIQLIMKRYLILFIGIIAISCYSNAQTPAVQGKPIAEIFTDFHYNINDSTKHTGYDLNRAFFGYQYLPEGNFSAKIIVNIGSPEDLAPGSASRRYAYCREASIAYTTSRLTLTMGITGTKLFDFQQKFWGKRYVANTYQSINGYGYVADLGVVADYRVNEKLTADITVMNGEGFHKLQHDDQLKSSLGFTYYPIKSLALRVYGEIQKQEDLWQPLFIAFAGFKNENLYFGGEFSYKSNIDLIAGHHVWGISGTGGVNITEKDEIFGRYDYISSVVLPGNTLKWGYLTNGSFLVAGIQHSFSQNIKIALDYQANIPYSSTREITDLIYLNALFKF